MKIYRQFVVFSGLLAASITAQAESLVEYAQKCDLATGITVPDFNCDAGTDVPATHVHDLGRLDPVTHRPQRQCDRPNHLHGECDLKSRFQVVVDNNTAFAVAHCRKQDLASGRYGDIAVIQHNRANGATCFYQALGDLNGDVKAPSKGAGSFWMSPSDVQTMEPCGMCHDNGAIIRSPYLNQLASGHDTLPGAGHLSFNKNQPYYYVGSTFSSWKAFRVEAKGADGKDNLCITCHRMGVNNLSVNEGTAREFGRRATAKTIPNPSGDPDKNILNRNKNEDSENSPLWMPPETDAYDPDNESEAKKIKACGDLFKVGMPLPDDLPNCKITQFSGPAEAPDLPLGGKIGGDPIVGASADGRLEIFARGNDSALWHVAQLKPNGEWPIVDTAVDRPDDKRPDATWSDWNSLGGQILGNPAIALNLDGRLEVFVRGTDQVLWHNWQTAPNGAWSGWRSLGGQLSGSPAVGINSDGRLDVFVRGTDDALWHITQKSVNGGWSVWSSLSGALSGDPLVGTNADGRLEVFVRGNDSALWHVRQNTPSGDWSTLSSMGGEILGDPALNSNADGRLEVFVRGKNHNALWHNWQTSVNAVAWSGWHSLAGQVASNVTVGQNGDGALEVFVRGTDDALWHNRQAGPNADWSGWKPLHGKLTGNVIVGRNANGRLEVFVRGADNALWHNWLVPGWN